MNNRISHRRERVAQVIIKALAQIFNEHSSQFDSVIITLHHIKMSPDLRVAFIYFRYISLDPDTKLESQQVALLLQKQAALLRRRLAARVYLKFLPELRFKHDGDLGRAQTETFFSQLAHP